MLSENGTQLTSQGFENFIKTLGVKHIPTATYHQISNGQAERYIQTVKNGLEPNYCNNKTLKERLIVINQPPAEMFIGRNIRTRTDWIKPHRTLDVSSNPHKNNLALRALSPNDHVIAW